MIISLVKAFRRDENGQDLVEYSLLMAFIALAAVGVLGTVKNSVSSIWTSINTQMSSVAGPTPGARFIGTPVRAIPMPLPTPIDTPAPGSD